MAERPKRRKHKDNPYTLSYNKITGSYIVEFKDNKNIIHNVEISDEVYQAFDKFELEDRAEEAAMAYNLELDNHTKVKEKIKKKDNNRSNKDEELSLKKKNI